MIDKRLKVFYFKRYLDMCLGCWTIPKALIRCIDKDNYYFYWESRNFSDTLTYSELEEELRFCNLL